MINDDMDSTDPSDAAPQDEDDDTAAKGAAERDSGTSEPSDYTSINPDDDNDNVGPAQA